jgi:hypothetical protein
VRRRKTKEEEEEEKKNGKKWDGKGKEEHKMASCCCLLQFTYTHIQKKKSQSARISAKTNAPGGSWERLDLCTCRALMCR